MFGIAIAYVKNITFDRGNFKTVIAAPRMEVIYEFWQSKVIQRIFFRVEIHIGLAVISKEFYADIGKGFILKDVMEIKIEKYRTND